MMGREWDRRLSERAAADSMEEEREAAMSDAMCSRGLKKSPVTECTLRCWIWIIKVFDGINLGF